MLKRRVKRGVKEKGDLEKKSDKGLSTIVATLLIILLTLVAVGIIWVVVRNVVQGGAEQVSLGKFTLNLEIKDVIIDPANPNNVNIRIKRDAGEGEIYGLKFIIDDGNTTEVVSLDNYSMNELEERTINLTLKSITNASNIIKISVAPIFKLDSGKEVTGDVKDVYDISKSSGSVTGGTTCSGSTSQSCSITNGVGSQSRTCTNPPNWDSWGTCTVVSCDSGYMQSGNTCVASTCSGSNFQSCTITNGVGNQTRTCNAGNWSAWGTCTAISCNSGYMLSGNTCVAVTGTYYISTTGVDGASGSSSAPWRTLAYACAHATTSGNIIHVNAGTFTETSVCNLAVGVSIEGEGVTSVILSHVGGTSFTISLYSSSQGTNGNQHISNIKMDGDNLIGYGAIKVDKRGNVDIHDCTFVNFNYYGVGFDGDGTGNQPATYPTGNKFHDNTVTNCAGYFPAGEQVNGEGKYAVGVNGQDGLLIYNNNLDQTSRPAGSNGYLIKGVAGFNKGVKIYNNIIAKAPYDGLTWDFAIELWMSKGGIEIYNNTITGGSIDLSGGSTYTGVATQKGSYAYGAWIHDNTIGPTTISNYFSTHGILIEQSATDVIIERNYIKNVAIGIYSPLMAKADGTGTSLNNIRISYNIFENIGRLTGPVNNYPGYGIFFPIFDDIGFTCDNVNILNNVMTAYSGSGAVYSDYGIVLPSIGTTTNVNVKNNIVQGFYRAPVYGHGFAGYTLDYLSIQNNIFYSNGNSNTPLYSGITPTHYTNQNNIINNPLFVSSSNFHLQSGSPAINAGINVGLTSDYEGKTVNNPPDIGAYEYP